jgi:P27 family predicted phage terminase small subunit
MNETTTKSKQIKGTLQKCRIKNKPAYEILTEVPMPGFKLDPNGLDYFVRFCQMLIDNKLMTAAYVPMITRAARWYEIYKEADGLVKEHGASQVTSTGYTQKSGYLTVMTDADDRVTKIEEKFGMSLITYMKLDIPKQDDDDELSELKR